MSIMSALRPMVCDVYSVLEIGDMKAVMISGQSRLRLRSRSFSCPTDAAFHQVPGEAW